MKRFFKMGAIIDDATMSTLGMYVSAHVRMYLGVWVAVELIVCKGRAKPGTLPIPANFKRSVGKI